MLAHDSILSPLRVASFASFDSVAGHEWQWTTALTNTATMMALDVMDKVVAKQQAAMSEYFRGGASSWLKKRVTNFTRQRTGILTIVLQGLGQFWLKYGSQQYAANSTPKATFY